MTVYLGKKPVGVTKIVKKEIAKTKFGVSIDNLLGNVDANGKYTLPSAGFNLDLRGIKSIPMYGMYYAFANRPVTSVDASTVVHIAGYGMAYAFARCYDIESIDFSSLERLDGHGFDSAFKESKLQIVSFPKLINVSATNSFGTSLLPPFPVTVTELHFRADVQSSIESQQGYAKKFGATNGTIYFDL